MWSLLNETRNTNVTITAKTDSRKGKGNNKLTNLFPLCCCPLPFDHAFLPKMFLLTKIFSIILPKNETNNTFIPPNSLPIRILRVSLLKL